MKDYLDKLLDSTVTVLTSDNQKYGNIKANIDGNIIIISNVDIPFKQGDLIIRKLPNSTEEKYKIKNPIFKEKSPGLREHFQITVIKES